MNKQTIRWGCGLAALVIIVMMIAGTIFLANRELNAAQYPGSQTLPDRSGTQFEAGHLQIRQVFRSRDSLRLVVGPNRHPVTPESVAGYAARGVEQLVVPLFGRSQEKLGDRADGLLDLVGSAG